MTPENNELDFTNQAQRTPDSTLKTPYQDKIDEERTLIKRLALDIISAENAGESTSKIAVLKKTLEDTQARHAALIQKQNEYYEGKRSEDEVADQLEKAARIG